MTATQHNTYAACPICHAQIHPFRIENQDFGCIIFRLSIYGQSMRYGNSDSPRVYSKSDRLIVVRSVNWQVIGSQRVFVYSVSEGGRQLNYCFDDYDEAMLSFLRCVQEIQDLIDTTWQIARVSANNGLPYEVSFVDFVAIMRLLSTTLQSQSFFDDHYRRANVCRVLQPLMLPGRLINCLSDIYGAYHVNPKRADQLYLENYEELAGEEAVAARRIHASIYGAQPIESRTVPALSDSGLSERRFRRFDVT